jgi:MFS superfamily sulfate permease-like transporter
VVVILGIWATRQFGLDEHGVEIVGPIQAGVPSFMPPAASRQEWMDLLAGAVGIVLIMYVEALAAARTFAAKYRYEIDANQELYALGMANLWSGLAGGFVVGGGMSGTAANATGGARTQLSPVVAAVLCILTMAFLLPLLHDLPQAVLAAIVIKAVFGLADVGELKRFARLRTGSIYVSLAALAGVLVLGILKGLVLAVCLTLIAVMKRISTPQESVLGRLGSTGQYADIRLHPEAEPVPGMLIYRPNGLVFFANANRVFQRLRQHIAAQGAPLRTVILNLEAVPETDVTSVDLLEQLREELQASGIRLALARLADPVEDLLRRSGFLERLGTGQVFRGVDLAVAACETAPQGAN